MDRLRTFGIVAHIDAGKTTLTERVLHDTGSQSWVGSVDEGTAAMDFMPAERARGISITAAATRVGWGAYTLQIVDTPGHVDFVAEVERCLRVIDGVVVLVDGVRGVESQTRSVWEQAVAAGLPRLVFVNKLDRKGADFDAVLAEVSDQFECRTVALVVPLLDQAGAFAGLGDALTGSVQWFEGRPPDALVPALQRRLLAAHEQLLEALADHDERVLEAVVAGERLPAGQLRDSLKAAFLAGDLQPVLCGAALYNRGVDWLLDAVCAFLPAVSELPPRGIWSLPGAGDPGQPFCGLVFKVQRVDDVWNYVRVVRGRVVAGVDVARGNRPQAGLTEVPQLWSMQADRHEVVASAGPGEVVVVPGDLGWRTGDTVCDPAAPAVLAFARFPPPVLAVTFEPDRAEDTGPIFAAVQEVALDDPTLRAAREHDRIVVRGMGELHLEVVADLVRERVDRGFRVSRPRVARREAVAGAGRGSAEVRAVVGGAECAARCAVEVVPRPPAGASTPAAVRLGEGVDPAIGGLATAELQARVAAGQRAGPLHDAEVVVVAAARSGPGASDAMVEQAASKALDQALGGAGLVELEPWVSFEVVAPAASSNPVLADLRARGAEVSSVAAGRLGARLTGRAPLASMIGYVTRLRSISKGLGQVSMRPDGFAPGVDDD